MSRIGYLISLIYDTLRTPDLRSGIELGHLKYYGSHSRILYVAGVLEKNPQLWDQLLEYIIENKLPMSEKAIRMINALQEVEVYGWEDFEKHVAKEFAPELAKEFNRLWEGFKLISYKIFGLDISYLQDVYVIVGYNPFREPAGSLLSVRKGEIVISVYINEDMKLKNVLDLIYHKLLYAVVKLSELKILDQYKDEIIEALAPEGYVSQMLGITESKYVPSTQIGTIVKEYFDNKLYEKDITLHDYIRDKLEEKKSA